MSLKTTLTRTATAVLALGALGSTVAGCSTSGGGAGGDETTLTVATNGGTGMEAVVDQFEEDNPGITVKLIDAPDSYQQVTATQLTGGTAADVLQIFPGTGNNISAKIAGDKGFFSDLSDEDWVAELPEASVDLLSNTAGEIVAVPMAFSSIGGIYNADTLAEVGLIPPTTWDEVLQFCADATAAGKVAYGLGLSDTWTTQLIPYALTATLVYAPDPDFAQQQVDGTASFSDSAWVQALEQYQEMEDAGCFNPSPNGTAYSQVQEAIADGSTIGTVSVAAETQGIQTVAGRDLNLTYEVFPATNDAEETYLSATVGPSFAVNAKATNQELAKKFIAFLADPATQVVYADAYGDTAALPGDEVQETTVAETVSGFVSDNKISTWPDQLWPSTTIQPAMFDGIQALFTGQQTIADVLATMDAAFAEGSTPE